MSKLYGTEGDGCIEAIDDDDTMIGFTGDDNKMSWLGNHLIQEAQSNDSLLDEAGDDFLLSEPGCVDQTQSISPPAGEEEGNDQLVEKLSHDVCVYTPGDGFKVIDNESGVLRLSLQGILSREVTVSFVSDNWLSVSYSGKPIVQMRGVESIHTEDGCFSIFHWL